MNSRTRSRRPTSIGSNQSSRRWIAVSACDCRAAEFVLLLVMAWSPPALKRRDCLGFRTPRLRHLQFQPHPGRHLLEWPVPSQGGPAVRIPFAPPASLPAAVSGRGGFTHTAYNDFEIVAANLLRALPGETRSEDEMMWRPSPGVADPRRV